MPSRYAVVSADAISDPRLTDGDVRVLAALGSFANPQGECFPSVRAIAQRAGKATRSVHRSLNALEGCGYVERVNRWGRSSVYVVKLDTPDTTVTPDTSGTPPMPLQSPTPDTSVTHNVPKERSQRTKTEVSQRNPMTPEQIVCATANKALRENPRMKGESEVRPLMASRATQQVKDWLAEGIPLEVVQGAVERVCLAFIPTPEAPRIGSFKYFDASVRKAWKAHQEPSENAEADKRVAEIIAQMQQDYEKGAL